MRASRSSASGAASPSPSAGASPAGETGASDRLVRDETLDGSVDLRALGPAWALWSAASGDTEPDKMFEALFTAAADLIDDLTAATRDGLLRQALARYLEPHVLVVDEVGYLAYGDTAANVLFHVVNERHIMRRAIVFTTKQAPTRWGAALHDEDLAHAIVDRILHRGGLCGSMGHPSGPSTCPKASCGRMIKT